jgi:SAM-dependent methyltransferase
VLIGDAESLPFGDASIDRVLCSFAIFLLPDLQKALSEFHRVLTPAGRVGLAYSAGTDPDWAWYDQLVSRYEPTASLGTERWDAAMVEVALGHVGFTNIATRVEACDLVFVDAPQWWGWVWSHGDRAVLESLTGDLDKFKREVFADISRRASGDGLSYRVPAAITFGTKR